MADRAGVREAIQVVGGLALGWSVVWWLLIRKVRHRPLFDEDVATAEPLPDPGPEPV